MPNENGEHIYVAELKVPTCFYPSNETRYAIDKPAGFEISKGYYVARPPSEESIISKLSMTTAIAASPYALSEFDQTADHQFRQYLQSISSIDGKTRYQLQSAIHWYGISISSDDPTVSYVAAWTGLGLHSQAHLVSRTRTDPRLHRGDPPGLMLLS